MRVQAVDRRQRIVSGIVYLDQPLHRRLWCGAGKEVVEDGRDGIKVGPMIRCGVEQSQAPFVVISRDRLLRGKIERFPNGFERKIWRF